MKPQKRVEKSVKTAQAGKSYAGPIFGMLSLGIVVAGVFLYIHYREEPKPPARQQGEPETVQTGASRKQEKLLKEAASVRKQAEAGSLPMAAAIKRLNEIKLQISDAEKRGALEADLEDLVELHQQKVRAVIADIRKKVEDMSVTQDEQEALSYLASYSGPYRQETAVVRSELQEVLQKRIEQNEREVRRREILYGLAQAALKADFEEAVQQASRADGFRDLDDTVRSLEEAAKCQDMLLQTFRDQIGQVVSVGIAGKSRQVKIIGILNDQIVLGLKVNGDLQKKRLSLSFLDEEECHTRLADISSSARNLYLGALAVQRKDLDAAAQLYAQVTGFAGQLSRALKSKDKPDVPAQDDGRAEGSESESRVTEAREGDADEELILDDDLGRMEELLFASQASAHNSGIARELAVASAIQGEVEGARKVLRKFIKRYFEFVGDKALYKTSEIEAISSACDAWMVLRNCFARQPGVSDEDFIKWLLADNHRLRLVAEATREGVDWPRAAKIIKQLYLHDPDMRDKYFEMILAFGVVWDSPRSQLHHQTGGKKLSFDPNLPARYDYFKDIYETPRGKMPYERLSWWSLTFVVDTPVPLSELQWVRNNIRGSLNTWGKKFSEIEYDYERLEAGELSWVDGPYTLEAIEDHGGICVDQAYYGAMTARALGIPAVQFSGRGKRGFHAWFGYMTNQQNWELEAGRYEYDDYAIGRTKDPRTNKTMTDHEAAFACDPVFQSRDYEEACRYSRIAETCDHFKLDDALPVFIEKALLRVDIYPLAWDLKEKYLERNGDRAQLMRTLDRRLETFRRYPDERCAILMRKAGKLHQAGDTREAEELLANEQRRFARQRFDLAEQIFNYRLALCKESENAGDRRMELLEEYLSDNDDQGSKLLPYVEKYMAVAKNTDNTKKCARFLKRLVRRVETDDSTRQKFRQLHLEAENSI